MVTSSPPQGGGTTGVDSPATPEQERPRRRQPSAARSRTTRDTSLTQFAVMDDENVSQQVRAFRLFRAWFLDGTPWFVMTSSMKERKNGKSNIDNVFSSNLGNDNQKN